MKIAAMNSVNFKGHVTLLVPMDKKLSQETKETLNQIKAEAEKNSPEKYSGIITVREAKKYPNSLMISMYDMGQNGPYDVDKEYLSIKHHSIFMPVNLTSEQAKNVKNMIATIYKDKN